MMRTGLRAGFPVLELWQPGAGRQPLVIAQHGYTARKEFILPQAYHLAMSGFFTVVPDAWHHGDRGPGTALWSDIPGGGSSASGLPAAPGPDLFACTAATARDLDALLATYDGDERADSNRAGLVGYSMGGMICFYYLTLQSRRIKALCPVIGTPDWPSILTMAEARALCAAMGAADEAAFAALEAQARAGSPSNITAVEPLPMLVQNGAQDPLIPPGPVLAYIEAIRPRWQDPAALEAHIYPGLGHADTVEINFKIAAWLKKYL